VGRPFRCDGDSGGRRDTGHPRRPLGACGRL